MSKLDFKTTGDQEKHILCKNLYIRKNRQNIAYFNYENPCGIFIADKRVETIVNLLSDNYSLKDISEKLKIDPNLLNTFVLRLKEKNIIENDNYIENDTLNCWLHVTNNCNFNCQYCYVNKSKTVMSIDIAKKTINNLIFNAKKYNYKRISVSFSGGEPLLRFEFIKDVIGYCETFKDIEFKYIILTNGSLLNNKYINYIKEKNITITLSLDGIKRVNDKKRYYKDGSGTYDDVIEKVNLLINNEIFPKINIVVTSSNIDTLPTFIKKIIRYNVPFRISFERSTNSEIPSLLNDKKKLINKIIKSLKIIKNASTHGQRVDYQICDLSFYNNTGKPCGAGTNIIAVGCNGEIGFCGMGLSNHIGYLNDETNSLELIRNHELAKYNVNNSIKCNNCTWKKVCNNECPIFNYNVNNNYIDRNVYCDVYKKIIPYIIDIEMVYKKK